MGISTAFRLIEGGRKMGAPAIPQSIVSPFSESTLSQIVYADIFGANVPVVTRAEAMTIPAVARARQILISTIARYPLRAYNAKGLAKVQPDWLDGTNSEVSAWHRMAATIDDLIFYPASLWVVARDDAGKITAADRCPIDRWQLTAEGEIRVDGQSVGTGEVIYIPSPFEGLLTVGSRTIRGGANLDRNWVGRAANPIPAIELHQTTDDPLTVDEVQGLVSAWADARQDVNGAIAFTPNNIEVRAHGSAEPTLFIEGRNFLRIDIGAFLGIPAALMDASLSTASLTYSTQEGQRNEFADYTLPYWVEPIQRRLSLDDVVPSGEYIRFDLSDLFTTTPSPTGAPVKD